MGILGFDRQRRLFALRLSLDCWARDQAPVMLRSRAFCVCPWIMMRFGKMIRYQSVPMFAQPGLRVLSHKRERERDE